MLHRPDGEEHLWPRIKFMLLRVTKKDSIPHHLFDHETAPYGVGSPEFGLERAADFHFHEVSNRTHPPESVAITRADFPACAASADTSS
jgi:hypothetical protein